MESAPDSSTGTLQRAHARVGTVLRQKWRLDSLLGVGGMAAVYAATHRNGARGAVKVLHMEYSALSEVKRRFLREGYVGNQVGHAGVVRVLDDDIADDGSAFLVMELLIGETLDALRSRRGGKLSPEEALPILDDLLDILASAHAARVIHRDIKPDNVFITSEGRVMLLDFGIARLETLQAGSLATVSGSTFGTPAFMPPEQALGHTENIDGQSDVWGAGAVLFNALSGKHVHEGRTLNEKLVAHATRPVRSLATVAPTIDRRIVAVVDTALAFHKSERWLDARQMQTAIRDIEAALGIPRLAPLALRTDPRVVDSGLQRAVAQGQPSSPFASMPATSSAIARTGGNAEHKGGSRTPLLVGVLAGMLSALAVFVVFVVRHRVVEPGAASASAGPPESSAGLKPPLPSPSPIAVEKTAPVESAPAPVAPMASAESPPSTAAPASAATTRRLSGRLPAPASAKSTAPKPAGDGDWLERQH